MAGQRITTGPTSQLFDYDVYAMCGDGDMMEGVASEAASLAGHLMLGNLCWIYDFNRITIEGHTDLAFSEDVAARFLAYGWNVPRVGDANDTGADRAGDRDLPQDRRRPTLIIVDSHIGYGAPHKHDTSAAHGEPLGEEDIRLAKRRYGWPEDAQFRCPTACASIFAPAWAGVAAISARLGRESSKPYRAKYPDLADQLGRMQPRDLPTACTSPAFSPTPRALPPRLIRQGTECRRTNGFRG